MFSPQRDGQNPTPSSSHQPVTPQTFSPTSPTRLPLPATSHSHDQIIFQPPEICLARQKSAAQSWFSAQAHTASLVSGCLSATTKKIGLLFYQLGLCWDVFVCLLDRCKSLPVKQVAFLCVYLLNLNNDFTERNVLQELNESV